MRVLPPQRAVFYGYRKMRPTRRAQVVTTASRELKGFGPRDFEWDLWYGSTV
jgi:hypothetical protein